MTKPRKIAFIDDVLRHKSWSTKQLYADLLHAPAKEATGIDPGLTLREAVWRNPPADLPVSPRTISPYIADNDELWIQTYDRLTPELENFYAAHIDADVVNFGFELSTGLRLFLQRRNILYVDFRVSPIRFLPDLLIAARSNFPDFSRVTQLLSIRRAEIGRIAGELGASFRHRNRTRLADLEYLNGATIFIGQIANDSALARNGKMACAEDHRQEISGAVKGRRLAYLPNSNGDHADIHRELAFLRGIDPSCEPLSTNIYDIMCAEQDVRFIGLSSGILQEAEFFGKKAHGLIAPVCPLLYAGEQNEPEGYWQIPFDIFTDADFLRAILGNAEAKPQRLSLHQIRPNALRDLHNVWWGYLDHIAADKVLWRKMEEKLFARTEKNLATLLDLLQDNSANGIRVRQDICRHDWVWMDGGIVKFVEDGTVMRRTEACGRYVTTASEAVVLWHGGEWLDRLKPSDDGNKLNGINNVGFQFEVCAAKPHAA